MLKIIDSATARALSAPPAPLWPGLSMAEWPPGTYRIVDTEPVPVQARLNDGDVVGELTEGTVVRLVGFAERDHDGDPWGRIASPHAGWFCLQVAGRPSVELLSATSSSSSTSAFAPPRPATMLADREWPPGSYRIVDSEAVAVQERPNDGAVLGELGLGQVVDVLDVELDGDGDPWGQASAPIGGWFCLQVAGRASAELAATVEAEWPRGAYRIVDRESVVVSVRPNDGESVGNLPRGTAIEVLEVQLDGDGEAWGRIGEPLTGWLCLQAGGRALVRLEDGEERRAAEEEWPAGLYRIVGGEAVAVQARANDGEVVGNLHSDDLVHVAEVQLDDDGDPWGRTAEPFAGWFCLQLSTRPSAQLVAAASPLPSAAVLDADGEAEANGEVTDQDGEIT